MIQFGIASNIKLIAPVYHLDLVRFGLDQTLSLKEKVLAKKAAVLLANTIKYMMLLSSSSIVNSIVFVFNKQRKKAGVWVNVFDGEIIKGSVDTDFSNILIFNPLTFDINKREFALESVGYWTDKDYIARQKNIS